MSSTRTVRAWAAAEPTKPLTLITYEQRAITDDEVEVKVLTCGLCFSDVDALDGKYGPAMKWPLVPGHEGVGRVHTVGANVKHLKAGQLVGLGVYRFNCASCTHCTNGRDNGCDQKALMFAMGENGAFGEYVRINARLAIPIPDGIEPEYASPLMCAGVTMFAPFRVQNIRPGDKVGIVGIGGLGHLGVMFAKHWGCDVYAFTSSTDKTQFIKDLGAHHVVNYKDEADMKSITNKLNFILVTNSGSIDYAPLFNALTFNGKIVIIGADRTPYPLVPASLIMGQKGIVGSAAGSSGVCREMLEFAALHQIKPMIKKYEFKDVNQAIQDVRDNKVRFRAVLVHEHKE